jgi:PadR family transcriptional regulator PadR
LYCKVLIFGIPLQQNYKNTYMMNIENSKSQMRKGMLEYCVLLLLKHGPSYASDIIQQLRDAKLLVVEGTLYPLLTRLKNDGLLRYEWQESTQGPPRKYYALSAEGEHYLEGLDGAWTELANTINYLKNIHPNPFLTV